MELAKLILIKDYLKKRERELVTEMNQCVVDSTSSKDESTRQVEHMMAYCKEYALIELRTVLNMIK